MRKLPNKRNRGVILTPQGWSKLQDAMRDLENNPQNNLTLEELGDRTGLSPHTVSTIQGLSAQV